MEYDYSAFESKTGIRVVIHDSILDDGISADMRRNLESGRNTSWFDRDSLAIHIYTGYYSKRPEPENIYANIIYQALSFFPPSRLLNKEHKGLSLPRTDTATGYLTLMDMVNRDSVYLDRLSSALSSALGFPGGGKFSDAVRAGVTQAAKHAERQAIEKGDPAYFASKIRSALENPYSCRSVRAGTVSDPMRAVDYPAGLPVYLNVERLYSVWKASGMDIMSFSAAVARGISNPAAILERDKPKQNGEYEYCIIADSILPDGVLAISVSHPRKTLSEVIANRENKPRGISGFPVTLKPAWMNRMLEHALDNQQKGNPAKGWLRSEDKWFGKEYTLLDIIKSETSKATVTSSALFAWSLKTATNIRNNFLNPKIPDADYSPVLNEMERRDRIDELIRAIDPVGMSVTPPSETERRKQKFRTSSLSAKTVSVLREQDALTVEGVIRLGPDKLCSLTNQATVKKVEKALQEAGFSLYNRRRATSEKDFTILSEQAKDKEILNDFRESLRLAPEGLFRNLELRTPVRLDGKPVPPEGAVHLIVKSSSMGSRWSSSPLFLTASELEGMGAEPLPTASVTHVRTEDGFVSLYNVRETNLESKFLALYELVTSHAEKGSKPLSPYMKVALNQVVRKDLSAEMAGQASDILVRFWRKDVPEFSIRKDVPHIKESTGSERNGAVAGNPSSVGLSESRQGAPKPSFLSATSVSAKVVNNTLILKKKAQNYINEHDIILENGDTNEIVRRLGKYFGLEKSKSSLSYYGDYYEGDLILPDSKTVRVRLSQHPASRDRVAKTPTDDLVSIVVYKNGETLGQGEKPYIETTYHLSGMSPEMIVESIGEGMGRILKDGLFFDKFGVFETILHEGDRTSVIGPDFSFSNNSKTSSIQSAGSAETLATKAVIFLATSLRNVGINVEEVDEESALTVYASHGMDTEFSGFRLEDGKIYGYQLGDTIYLTKDGINPNTPIHEYAHMWAKVFQQTSPESWKSIKDELKATPLWSAVSEASEYSYIDGDEDRLAGEVLATMVGDKGEELMLLAAGETLMEEPKKSRQLKTTVSNFRQRVTNMAAEDVFKMPELKNTGELTLYLLQDFANGRLMAYNTAERFSSDYERHKAGLMKSHELFEFGMPKLILRAAGVAPYPIRLTQKTLDEHIPRHGLPDEAVLSLPVAIQTPIMVYKWGRTVPSMTIITEYEFDDKKLTLAIQTKCMDGVNYVNDIRTIHGKELQTLIKEINDPDIDFAKEDLCWVNKEKVLAWFSGTEALTSSIGYKQELISAAKVINDFDNPKLFSQNAEFSIKKSTDMRHTPQTAVYDKPEWFSLMQLQGARSRVSALLNILTGGSLLIFEDVLAIHKEMAAEGLLNQFSVATPGKGLFRADSIQELDLKSIFMGRTGGANSASLWDITVNTDPSVPEEDGKYNTALNQYIHTLTYSLTRTKDLLDKAIEEAKDEREDVMATRQKKGLKEKVVDGALKLYSFIWGETKTKYPLDPPSRMSIYKEDQEMAYLNRIGITSDALSIVMNGMEYGHEGRMETLVSRPSVPVLSRGDIIAPIEATMRRVLLSAAGLADDKGVVHLSNKLPVIYPNGQAFIGTPQSILRLAMETEHLSIPVVVDNELMNQLGIEPVGEPLSLGLGQSDGAMVKKEFWFLEQTDFKDIYPTHFDGLSVQFRALNAERSAKGPEIMASFPHVPSVFGWAGRTLNPIQMAMFDIALETSLGYCDSVSLPVTNENVERLSMQDLTVLSVQYNSGEADRDFLYQEASKVDGIIQDSAKEVFAGREPERGFDFESILSRADKGKDAAEGYEYAGAEAVEETGQAEENEASLQESAEADFSF